MTWSGCSPKPCDQLTYWLVTRAETLRRPGGGRRRGGDPRRMHEQRDVLLGAR